MQSPRLLLVLVGAVALLLVANCWVKPPVQYEVTVVTPPAIIASLPHWVAEEKDFYVDEGLRVKTVDLTSSDLMVQALVDGDADVLPAVSLVDVVNGAARSGLKKPLIFSHSRMRREPPFESILVLRGSNLATLRDLEGKRVAVYPGITSRTAVARFLELNGLDISSVEFYPLPPPEHILALQRGDVAASHIYEPLRTQNLQAGRTRELSGSIYAFLQDGSAIGVSALSAQFVRDREDAANSFLKAWDRSISFIRNQEDEARAILARHLKLPQAVAEAATWVDATKSTEVDQATVIGTAKLFQELEVIASSAELDETLFLPESK